MQTWLLLGSPRLALLVSQPPMTPLENKDYLRAMVAGGETCEYSWWYRLSKMVGHRLGFDPWENVHTV